MGILIIPAIIFVYGFLGYKLNKNYILWGLMGAGIILVLPLLTLLIIAIGASPMQGLVLWQLSLLVSLILSVVIAAIIAFRNNSIFKRSGNRNS